MRTLGTIETSRPIIKQTEHQNFGPHKRHSLGRPSAIAWTKRTSPSGMDTVNTPVKTPPSLRATLKDWA